MGGEAAGSAEIARSWGAEFRVLGQSEFQKGGAAAK